MDKIRYYKGLHKVKVVTESIGYYIIEAQEAFEDIVDDKKIKVKKGEQRIVTPDTLYKEMTFLPPIQEHAYELKMEKKLKHLIADQEKQNQK
ncbi:hypothetical protein JJE00_04100 [Candidatus Bathyarchaeota archaeon]|nr:hypothetical protein [Candidatus Bathyarchaeota archaeon]